jgi:hypothetical protein
MMGSMLAPGVSEKAPVPCARLRGDRSWSHLPVWEPQGDAASSWPGCSAKIGRVLNYSMAVLWINQDI